MRQLKFIRFFAHPLFIAGILSLMLMPILFNYFPKYKAKVTEYRTLPKLNSYIMWADLLNDGESETIMWFINTEGKAALQIIRQNGVVIDQKAYDGKSLILRNPPLIADLDKDLLPEIYVFYHRKDSLFFSSVKNASSPLESVSDEVFIAMVSNSGKENDYHLDCSVQDDLDGDDVSELIFTLNAGFPVNPRNIFCYNFIKKEWIQSKFLGGHSGVNCITDLNGDGRKELFVGQYAPGNLKDTLIDGVNDLLVRLLVLNDRLEPVFTPPVFNGEYSGITTKVVRQKNKIYIAALVSMDSVTGKNFWLMLYNPGGKLISKRNVTDVNKKSTPYLFEMRHSGIPVHILSSDGKLTGYDLSLQPVEMKKYKLESETPFELDIDLDGENEYLLYGRANSILTVARSEMTHLAHVKLPVDVAFNGRVCLKKNVGKPDEFFFQYDGKYCLVSYSPNPFFPFRFLFLLLGLCLLSGFFFLMQFIQRLVLREKYLAERRVSELQMLLIRNQISPHFLFNAINSISYRLMEKNPEEANNSIIRLSRLIRNNLVATDRFSRTLKEELEAATAYVEIVCSQREEPFQFTSRVETGTNMDIEVPVLIIQNYLENAVKHGIRTLGSKGRIIIDISQDKKYLYIRISDNGIGRQKAAEHKQKQDSTGKGMGLMQLFFDEVNKYNENKISAVIRDLSDENGAPSGTQVKIEIPVNMKYRIYEK